MNLIQNIISNFVLLREDFIGFSISFSGIGNFFHHILITFAMFIIFYLFGEKICNLFFRENKKYKFFINIALGYIVIGTGIGILGAFSLLRTEIIWVYLLSIGSIALYKFSLVKVFNVLFKNRSTKKWITGLRSGMKKFIVLGVFLFVFIAFLRLMTPEITEDAYHTDLPRLYLASGTTIHEPKDPLRTTSYPQLPEMIYMIPIFLQDKETTRFVHFGFYLLIIFLLFSVAKLKESSFAKFAPLLFVTAPVMIRYSPSQYTDFFAVFFFLLAALLVEKKMRIRQIILVGIILGAVFSAKMWTLIYFPVFVLYILILNRKQKTKKLFLLLGIFCFSTFSVVLLWYVRSYIITGNPVYPVLAKIENLEVDTTFIATSSNYFGFNGNMFVYQNMIVYSPFFFLGIVFFLFNFRKIYKNIKHFLLYIFFVLIMLEQLIVKVDLGRYLVVWYTVSIIIVSAGVSYMISKNKINRYLFIFSYFICFSYYFLNTLFTLPYGFGWADKNAYLTRVLGRDNASYYDFDHKFNKWISEKDIIATYGIFGYYYADFKYIDINYIFSRENRSFDSLKKKKVTKLLVKGGEIEWFCKSLSLINCSKNRVKLMATWPDNSRKYNLYELR